MCDLSPVRSHSVVFSKLIIVICAIRSMHFIFITTYVCVQIECRGNSIKLIKIKGVEHYNLVLISL